MKLALSLLCLLLSSNCISQFSKTHYLPPLSSSFNVAPEEQYIYISTPSLTPINFRIISLGSVVLEATVSRDVPYVSEIGYGPDSQLDVPVDQVGTVLSNKGLIVEADDLVYVSLRVLASLGNHAGAVVSKGLAALGTNFRIGGFVNLDAPNYINIHYTFVSILATENNTIVNFSDLAAGISLLNNAAAGNTPASVTLNSGESYVMAVQGPTEANRDGLIGALVSSDKPIAVTCGSFGGTNGQLSNLDLGFDQIVSEERTGTDYIFIRATGQDPVEKILLIGNEEDTDIYVNGDLSYFYTIDAGQYLTLDGSNFTSNGNLYIKATKNVFAYQSIGDDGRPDQANQEMFFVPPLSCQTSNTIDNIPFLDMVGSREFNGRVTIITETGAELNFIINGQNYTLDSLPASANAVGPLNVTGNADYVTYSITGLSGNVSVFSSGQLYLASYGSDDAATFGGFFSGFTFKPEVSFNNLDVTQSDCIPNIELSVSEVTAFDTFQWYYNGEAIEGATSRNYTPLEPGYFYVSALILACNLPALVSDLIPVSACSLDLDNDQVHDNIDSDNDNDGIANCTESYGDVSLNLSNSSAGILSTGNYSNSFTGSFPTSVGTAAATPFIGYGDGSFTSEVTAGKGNSAIYKIDFAQPLSIALEYLLAGSSAQPFTPDSECIISVPFNTTITVLNPTNQLLIDTNYDGIYESGVSQFTSFEIRFRLNQDLALAPGTGTFSFRSTSVSSVTYTLRNLLDSQNTTAGFRFIATCVAKDSDGDSVPDQFDYDSDNDGIPDLYESQGTAFSFLSGSDSNGDGLDNIFSVGFVPADTDSDGIPNYLDLDSDNDGIYDLYESAQNVSDNNNDGVIDGPSLLFGANGLLDVLETAVDSNIVSIPIADTDSDQIFNSVELDSDGDACFDVIEAGFSDANGDGILGSALPTPVNDNGVVTGSSDGYTAPNTAYITPSPLAILQQPQSVVSCNSEDLVLTIVTSVNANFQWQMSTDGITFNSLINDTQFSGVTTDSLTIQNIDASFNNNKFRVVLSFPGNVCDLISEAALLTVNPTPAVMTRILAQCDLKEIPNGITVFNLSEVDAYFSGLNDSSVKYYLNLSDAEFNLNELPNAFTNTSNPQQIAARVTNNLTGCFSFSILNLVVNSVANNTYLLPELCDDDGVENGFITFDLTDAPIPLLSGQMVKYYELEDDVLLEENEIVNPTAYTNLASYHAQTLFARVENANGCASINRIIIKVNPLPDINTNADLEPLVICVNSPTFSATLDAGILDGSPESDYTYQWFFNSNEIKGATSPTLTVDAEGTYWVMVTDNNGCSDIRMIPVVASSQAIIQNIEIIDLIESNTVTVTLTANSFGNYVFSLDHQNSAQQSNVFTNVLPGIHTVYVSDVDGCPAATQIIAVLGIPKFFTPNGDGFNDTWNVQGINNVFYPNTTTSIFDRYGKLLKQIGSGDGWDGTFNGNNLPADDYWYVVRFEDGKIYKGHFSLKR